MAETVTIARPYAEAAFKLAREKNALEAWSGMLRLLDLVVQDPAVARSIADPNVSAEQLQGSTPCRLHSYVRLGVSDATQSVRNQ